MVASAPNKSLISVILPVYNGEKFIEEALKSVYAQKYEPLEIILVNDGSTDNTEQVLKQFEKHIHYIYQDNAGPSNARNRGLKAAKGKYITFIDADDVWHPEKIRLQLMQFEKFKNLEISIGLTYKTRFETVKNIDDEFAKQEATFLLQLGSSMMKRTVFDEVGLFDEELLLSQDVDWFIRAREKKKKILVHKDLVVFYRKHSNNRTNNKKLANYYLFKVFKKAKDRKAGSDIYHFPALEKPSNMDELIQRWNTI